MTGKTNKKSVKTPHDQHDTQHDMQHDTIETINITTDVDHPGAMNLFAQDRGNFAIGETTAEQTDEKNPQESGQQTNTQDERPDDDLTTLLTDIRESIRDIQAHQKRTEHRMQQQNTSLREHIEEKYQQLETTCSDRIVTMQAQIATEIHRLFDPLRKEIKAMHAIQRNALDRIAICEIEAAQSRIQRANVEQRLQWLERREGCEKPQLHSTRLIETPQGPHPEETRVRESTFEPTRNLQGLGVPMKPPTFDGSGKIRPMKFIREFRQYCMVTRPTTRELKYLFGQSLERAAKEWWALIEDNVESLDELEKRFCRRFWSKEVQQKVRRSIEMGFYPQDAKFSRVEYAVRLFGSARDLTPRPNDEDIVSSLSRHFSEEIHATIVGRDIKDQEGLIEFLEKIDQGGSVNSRRAKQNTPKNPDQQKPYPVTSTTNEKNPAKQQQTNRQWTPRNSQGEKKIQAVKTTNVKNEQRPNEPQPSTSKQGNE